MHADKETVTCQMHKTNTSIRTHTQFEKIITRGKTRQPPHIWWLLYVRRMTILRLKFHPSIVFASVGNSPGLIIYCFTFKSVFKAEWSSKHTVKNGRRRFVFPDFCIIIFFLPFENAIVHSHLSYNLNCIAHMRWLRLPFPALLMIRINVDF